MVYLGNRWNGIFMHVKSCHRHDVWWIFKMSGKYLIVSDVLFGVWKSVISIPVVYVSKSEPTYFLMVTSQYNF